MAIAASGDPEAIELIATVLAPRAEPRGWAADATGGADFVVLAIRFTAFTAFEASLVARRVVVDTMRQYFDYRRGPLITNDL
ncbi:hypothetical protein [Micromonospora sp. NPDC005171]|uniref:hypothetical protein n=1 Tax=Micromonospora sp. NPDC005171 TaxID=3156866 RepID=UPI0033AC0F2E